MTRQQEFLGTAYTNVTAVEANQPDAVKKIYGGLCHGFPILVRSDGLCQALAFVDAKTNAAGARGTAYQLLKAHIAQSLQDGTTADTLLTSVRDAALAKYMRQTRTILQAWVYYKRFAESILHVTPDQEREGDQP